MATKAKSKRKRGHPVSALCTKAITDLICQQLAAGLTLRAICAQQGMPPIPTVCGWVINDKPAGFAEQYARARDTGNDVMADQIIEIADDSSADPRDRQVRIDARKWYLCKLAPRKYGDKIQQDVTVSVDVAAILRARREELARSRDTVEIQPALPAPE